MKCPVRYVTPTNLSTAILEILNLAKNPGKSIRIGNIKFV